MYSGLLRDAVKKPKNWHLSSCQRCVSKAFFFFSFFLSVQYIQADFRLHQKIFTLIGIRNSYCILSIAYNLKLSGLLYYLYTETMSTQLPLFTLPCFHSCRMSYSETLKYSSDEGFHCMVRRSALPLSLAEVAFVFYYFHYLACLFKESKIICLLLLFL